MVADGRRLSYVSGRQGGGGLVTRDLNGGPVHGVLPSGVQDHVWSPKRQDYPYSFRQAAFGPAVATIGQSRLTRRPASRKNPQGD